MTCREQFINIMFNNKYLHNFWSPKHFGKFSDDIFGYFWTLHWTGFEKGPNLTPPGCTMPVNKYTFCSVKWTTTLLFFLEETPMQYEYLHSRDVLYSPWPVRLLTCYTTPIVSTALLACTVNVSTNGTSRQPPGRRLCLIFPGNDREISCNDGSHSDFYRTLVIMFSCRLKKTILTVQTQIIRMVVLDEYAAPFY